jgi:hypothetical protein
MCEPHAFRHALVAAASAVMHCEFCRAHDQPQPGWVGAHYSPGRGLVVVLQNPAAAPNGYGSAREKQVQAILRDFTANPSVATHTQLMRFMLADMAGENGGKPWPKWVHPVSKLISDRTRLAWMNVVKFRTPGTTRKDDPLPDGAAQHGAEVHLQNEIIEILRPKAVIAFGADAANSVQVLQLPDSILVHRLKLQGASDQEIQKVRQLLLGSGVDI